MFRGFLALLSCCVALWGCEANTPELVSVFDVVPREVEAEDTLTLRGEGFPEGAIASVRFSGVVHRAGCEPETGFSVSTKARAPTGDRLEVLVDKALSRAFTESSDGPRHATFRGVIHVAFAPNLPGAPPVTGSREVFFDVFPLSEQGGDELRELSEFFGGDWHRQARPPGLVVDRVEQAGRLARAGVLSGDRIVGLGGLRVRTVSDMTPPAGARRLVLEVSRDGYEKPLSLRVEVEGYRPREARHWLFGFALLASLTGWLVLARSFVARLLCWLEIQLRAWVEPVFFPVAPSQKTSKQPLRIVPRGLAAFLGVSAVFACIRFGGLRAVRDFDLALLFVASSALCSGAQLLSGGYRRGGRWSLLRALSNVGRGMVLHLCVFLILFSAVLEHGTFSLVSASGGQGPMPWQVQWFQSPSSYVAGLAFLGVLGVHAVTVEHAVDRRVPLTVALPVQFIELVHGLILSGMIVALYFGGWQLPNWTMLGESWRAIGFQAKLTALYVGILLLNRSFPRVDLRYVFPLVGKVLLPLSVLAVSLAPVWSADVWAGWVRESLALGLFLLSVALGASLLLRAVRVRGKPPPVSVVNPWL